MNLTFKNIKHEFNLKGFKVGDTFVGCTKCWYQFAPEPQSLYCNQCNCGETFKILTVTIDDIKDL
jgi:hypothetical protein